MTEDDGKARPSPIATDLVWLGPIVNAHGIRGEVRLRPYNADTEALEPGTEVTIERGADRRTLRVVAARRHKNFVLLTLDGVADRNAAEALVGAELGVPAAELPPLAEGELYHFQLTGLRVVTTAGEEIGTIAEVFTTPASDVCVVRGERGEVLVPLVSSIVQSIDVDGGAMVIEPLPGLLGE